MKKIYLVLILAGAALIGCREVIPGPPGIPGRDGLDGLDGEEGYVFEYEFSFTAPDYSVLLNLPADFQMLDSDVMLIYLLWEVTEDGVEIWRAMPQTLYFSDGILAYNYDFTKYDASVFLDGTVNLDGLGAAYTDNWIARIVVVPAQYGSGRIDYTDYEAVKGLLDLPPSKLATKAYTARPQ